MDYFSAESILLVLMAKYMWKQFTLSVEEQCGGADKVDDENGYYVDDVYEDEDHENDYVRKPPALRHFNENIDDGLRV